MMSVMPTLREHDKRGNAVPPLRWRPATLTSAGMSTHTPHTPPTLCPNFAHALWATADRVPDAIAIDDRDASTTYAALRAHAAGIADALVAGGLRPGDRVGIWMDRSAACAAAFFGVLAAGGIAIIINEMLRPRQVEHILGHSSAAVLLTDAEMLSRQNRSLETAANVISLATLPGTSEF